MCSPSTALAMAETNRTIPSPEVTRIMAEMLQLKPEDKLMEIGTGSASQTQEWAKSGCEIHTIELQPIVNPEAMGNRGLDQVYAHLGDGKKGLPHDAPFTAIVATCGVSEIPEAWLEQLAVNGRMVVPLGSTGIQKLTLLRKKPTGALNLERIGAYTRFLMMK